MARNFFLFLALFLALATGALAEDWPQFLGPRANATSTETNLLDTWPESGPPILWQKTLGAGYGSPSILGCRLVVHHRVDDDEIIECLDPATGASLWRHAYPSHFVDPYGYNNGPRATPALFSDRCYAFGAEGKLTCLDLASGRLVWQRDTAADWTIPTAFFGVGSSPLLEDGRLIVMVGGQPNAGVVAFDPATGKTLWQSVGQKNWEGRPMTGWRGDRIVSWQTWEKQASYSTPVAATIHDRRQILCLMRQGLVSLNPTNGDVNFSFWFRAPQNESVNAMQPVVSGDSILISSAYYKTGSVLLRVAPDSHSVQEIWRGLTLELHWMTPICLDGFLYAFSGRNEPDARFRCVEFSTGRLLWDRDESWQRYSPDTPAVYGRGSLLLADGKLYALGEGGLLGIFQPSTDAPKEICRAQIPGLRHPCWAAPVLANRRLYLRGEDRLVCLDLAKNLSHEQRPGR